MANKQNFQPPLSLLPLDKGLQPFTYWSVDLATNLPTTPQGNKHLLIVVDPFSKWIELFPLKTKESLEISLKFYLDVICRFGKPHTIRSDGGTEFMGIFDALLTNIGTSHAMTSPNFPRSNGQAERFV